MVKYQKSHSFAALTRSISDTSPTRVKIPYSGSEINFFFSRYMHGKMWSPKSVNKIFPSQRNTNQNIWSPDGKFCSPMFLLRIRTVFPLTNKKHDEWIECRPYTDIRSFVQPLTVSSHFCIFSMCKRITNKQRPFNIRIFIRVIHQA